MINLRHLIWHIISCYTHKMAIVSWPYTMSRYFTLCIACNRTAETETNAQLGLVILLTFILMSSTVLHQSRWNVKGESSAYSIAERRFQSWSRFLAVSLQVTWVINPTVGCHTFCQLPSQPLRRQLPILLLGEQQRRNSFIRGPRLDLVGGPTSTFS